MEPEVSFRCSHDYASESCI